MSVRAAIATDWPATSAVPISRPIYFKGFNALRFYAALSVVVQHISYSPNDWFGAPRLPVTLERLFLTGSDAVNLFLVLSGFLITYLLLAEHARSGTVNIRRFYVRRAFRIYPVYFVYLVIVVVCLRPAYDPAVFLLLVFFMGNVAFVKYFPFPPFDHLWSLGVEEQYYLLAPVIARLERHIVMLLLAVIAIWGIALLLSSATNSLLSAFIQITRYDMIALGGLTACLYHRGWSIARYVSHPIALISASIVIGFAALVVEQPVDLGFTLLLGVAFAILICNMAVRPQLPSLLESSTLDYLGRLSYSMYVYHPLLILLFYTLFHGHLTPAQYQFVVYPVVIGLTLISSFVSYHFLEQPFLNLKARFASV